MGICNIVVTPNYEFSKKLMKGNTDTDVEWVNWYKQQQFINEVDKLIIFFPYKCKSIS